jgi:hypothetical protein
VVGITGYSGDHQGRFYTSTPGHVDQGATCFYHAGAHDLREGYGPYVGGMEVWSCPAVRRPPITDPGNTRFACYGSYNYWALDHDLLPDFGTGAHPPHEWAGAPSTQPLMQDRFHNRLTGDTWGVNHAPNPWHPDTDYSDGNPSTAGNAVEERHLADGANIAFFNGSVRWAPQEILVYVGHDTPTTMAYSLLP